MRTQSVGMGGRRGTGNACAAVVAAAALGRSAKTYGRIFRHATLEEAGVSRIRLYSSSDPNEAAAQRLDEKNGFKEARRERKLFATIIFRERTIVRE
jgi:cytidylate kinase